MIDEYTNEIISSSIVSRIPFIIFLVVTAIVVGLTVVGGRVGSSNKALQVAVNPGCPIRFADFSVTRIMFLELSTALGLVDPHRDLMRVEVEYLPSCTVT